MSYIGMMEARMPPGFRFHPRDEELVLDYLLHKLTGHGGGAGVAIVDVDLNKCEPWDLPDAACVGGKEWYLYSLRDRKYATGHRTNRATQSGYWKATGKDRPIRRCRQLVGMRKTLVFYQGRAPKGTRTEWVMHEFRLIQQDHGDHSPLQQQPPPAARSSSDLKEDWVLCRVFYKSRTTTPRPPSEEACTFSSELNLQAAPPLVPLIDTYIAFEGGTTMTAVEQVTCLSGLPALPFKGSVSFGDLLGWDDPEKKAIRTALSNMPSNNSNSKLELPPNWSQENALSQMWTPL